MARGSDKRPTHPGRNMVAGGLAGCVAKTCVAPLDRLKILLQGGHAHYTNVGLFKGLATIYRDEGFLAYWRGNKAQMLRVFPYAGVQFLVFERSKRLYTQLFGGESHAISFLAGSTAGICAVSITYPVDFLRARMAWTYGHQGTTVLQSAKQIWVQEGPAAFYRGIYASLLGMVFYAGVSFGLYDWVKHTMLAFPLLQERDHPDRLTTPANLVCGGLAGCLSQTVSYPIDVVRRRMQIDIHDRHSLPKYTGIRQTLAIVYKEGGFRAIFRGLSLNYLREFPQVGIAFVAYERLKIWLQVYREEAPTVEA